MPYNPIKDEKLLEAAKKATEDYQPLKPQWFLVLAKNLQGNWGSYGQAFKHRVRAESFAQAMKARARDRGKVCEVKIVKLRED